MTKYVRSVRSRSMLRYLTGLLARWLSWRKIAKRVNKLRKGGAVIGECTAIGQGCHIPPSANLVIGSHCSLQAVELDTRAPIHIGNGVIIGDRVHVLTCSHNIDSPEWDLKSYGIEIEDYAWIATKALILPSCRRIGRGAVVGAGSVVVHDVPAMAVVSGNPAQIIRQRKNVHHDLVVESLQSGDIVAYRNARIGIGCRNCL